MAQAENTYPGERLGLPDSGPGSIARFGRRLLALLFDLGTAALVAYAFFPSFDEAVGMRFADPLASNLIFLGVQILFLITLSASPGQLLFGMRLVRLPHGWPGLWRPVVRTLLLALIIPAVVWDRDQRGLHDRIAGTTLIVR